MLVAPVLIAPLLVMVPVAFKVRLPEPEMVAFAATVRLPATSTVTFEVARAADKAVAVEASIVKSVGSSNHIPALPLGAEMFTWAVWAMTSVPVDEVST